MTEFRRAKRRKVEHRIDVFDTMTERVIGYVGDLSENGMLLVLTHPLVSDALYQLRFTLTDNRGIDHPMDVGAHELWSGPAAVPGQAWTGFRFIDVSPSDLTFLRSWVTAPGSNYV